MLIEVEGIGSPNKGAELMLYAVTDRLRERFGDDVQICCRPRQGFRESYRLLGRKNILQLGYLTFKGMQLDGLLNCLPLKLTDTFGIARAKDVDIVLDASGLRYSDSWGVGPSRSVAAKYKKLKKQGKKIILLPQAFGPFENAGVGSAVSEIIENCDLCFARDDISYEYLVKLCGEDSKIRQAPDFTNLVEPISGFDRSAFTGKIAIIPNQRMLDKTDEAVSANYFQYLKNLCMYLKHLGEDLVIVNHEGAPDQGICERLASEIGGATIFAHWNPVYLKTALGCFKLVISSRFHGCVSALSQGVPVLATSWNHKYEMLLKDYGLAQGLLDLSDHEVDIKTVDNALEMSNSVHLSAMSAKIKIQSEEMWLDVFSFLDS